MPAYRENWQRFVKDFERLRKVVGEKYLDGKEALIIGPGPTPEEAYLLLEFFPGLSRLHLVDWHEPNIRSLEVNLDALAGGDRKYERVKLHLADAVNMAGLRPGSIHLVYLHQVVEHMEVLNGSTYPAIVTQKMLDTFREAGRVLVPSGKIFTLDTEITEGLEKALAPMGITAISADIWEKN
jgi:hypothetical protein